MQGSYWIWIIIVILIMLGGWWYFSQNPAPAPAGSAEDAAVTPATGNIDVTVDAIIESAAGDENAFTSEGAAALEATNNSSLNDIENAYDPSNF